MKLAQRFSQPVLKMLLESGWSEGRRVSISSIPLPDEFSLFAKAEQVLTEFGGLKIGESGRGVNRSASDVEIRPLAGTGLAQELKKYEPLIDASLYPIGYVENRHCTLLIDNLGRVYLINGWLIRRARDFDRALEYLLLGVKTDHAEIVAGWGEDVSFDVRID
jgi:hypothetical protein